MDPLLGHRLAFQIILANAACWVMIQWVFAASLLYSNVRKFGVLAEEDR